MSKIGEFIKGLFLIDVEKQVRWMEIFGILGFIILAVLIVIVWGIKLEVTIPAFGELELKGLTPNIRAEIDQHYLLKVKPGQKARIYLRYPILRKIEKIDGRVAEVYGEIEEGRFRALISTDKPLPYPEVEPRKKVDLKIVVDRKNLFQLLLAKRELREIIE